VMRGVGGGGMLKFLQSCSVRSAYLAPLGCGTRHSWQVVVGRWVLEVKRFRGRFQVVQACGRPIVMNCHVLKNDFSVNVFVNISLSMAQHACGCHPQFKGPAGRAISVSLKFSPCVRHAPSPRAGTNIRRTSDCGAQWATGWPPNQAVMLPPVAGHGPGKGQHYRSGVQLGNPTNAKKRQY
jgi:hypothetical protein